MLAVTVVGAFAWFFLGVTSHRTIGDLSQVVGPLAELFVWIQVTHAFDVPARRDLGFSLAGSATLMAVAGAQAVSSAFGLYVAAWAALVLLGLLAMWGSMAGGATVRPVTASLAGAGVLILGVGLVAILPPPHPASSLVFPSALAGGVQLPTPGALVGGAGGRRAGARRNRFGAQPGRRVPRLRRSPRHGDPGSPEQPDRAPGPSGTAVLLGRRDVRPLGRIELDRVHGTRRGAVPGDHCRTAVRHPAASRGGRRRAGRLANLLPGRTGPEPHLARRQRVRGLVAGAPPVRGLRRDDPLGRLDGQRLHLHRPIATQLGHPGRAAASVGGASPRQTWSRRSARATCSCPTPTPA